MGSLQLVAVLAFDERRHTDREMGTTLALSGLGNLALGDAHEKLLLRSGRPSIAFAPETSPSAFRTLQESRQWREARVELRDAAAARSFVEAPPAAGA